MVTRKPLPSGNDGQANDTNRLPYPTTPTSPKYGDAEAADYQASSAEQRTDHLVTEDNEHPPSLTQSISDISDGWVDGSMDKEDGRSPLPPVLRVAGGKKSYESLRKQPEIPPLLRVGTADGTPRTSSESQRSFENITVAEVEKPPKKKQNPQQVRSTNPFHKAQSTERVAQTSSSPREESSANIWAELAADPPPRRSSPAIPELQGLESFENLSLDASAAGPFSHPNAERLPELDHESPLISFEEIERQEKGAFGLSSIPHGLEAASPNKRRDYHDKIPEHVTKEKDFPDTPDWEDGSSTTHPQDVSRVEADGKAPPPTAQAPPPPVPPPRRDSLQTQANKQRSETYQIKHIRWLDSVSPEVRTSPILVQNANGPCPLLALVNALTLSTPASCTTALIETLRVREQVSLGLLLDAVFDELMSGRRGDAAQELPNVGDLYSFLITLHTGMNVNPRFVPTQLQQQPNLMDGFEVGNSPSSNDYPKPGGFEETKEMALYGTFAIPLIHGWLPSRSHPAFGALGRSARTYEDAQNLLFREEELEDKLQQTGLTSEEQLLLEDISSIKFFLSSSATQLTGYGLDTVMEALSPGSIAILFRNDHFSTLYRHPQTGMLLHLVTDMGYAGHEEVVWESLVDISGEGSEFFSGDFRRVGHHATPSPSQPYSQGRHDSGEWQTVTRSGRTNSTTNHQAIANTQSFSIHPTDSEYNLASPKNTEQEDADLALAMQLQEEEEDQSRRSALARRREDELSQAYLSSQPLSETSTTNSFTDRHNSRPSPSPNTTTAGRTTQTIRPLIPLAPLARTRTVTPPPRTMLHRPATSKPPSRRHTCRPRNLNSPNDSDSNSNSTTPWIHRLRTRTPAHASRQVDRRRRNRRRVGKVEGLGGRARISRSG